MRNPENNLSDRISGAVKAAVAKKLTDLAPENQQVKQELVLLTRILVAMAVSEAGVGETEEALEKRIEDNFMTLLTGGQVFFHGDDGGIYEEFLRLENEEEGGCKFRDRTFSSHQSSQQQKEYSGLLVPSLLMGVCKRVVDGEGN